MEEKKSNAGRKYGVPQRTENAKSISKLKWVREMRGFSQNSLADLSGVSVRNIRAFEQGQIDINKAYASTVYKLATALNVKMEELLDV